MIPPKMRAAIGVLGAAGLCGCWMAWTQRSDARNRRDAAIQMLHETDAQLQELVRLRTRAAVVDQRERPGDAMISPLRAALEQSGVGGQCLAGVSLPDPQPIASGELARQEATVTITGVRTSELARALVSWSQSQPLWTIRTIRLDRSDSSRAGPGAASDRFTAVITVDNIHLNNRRAGQSQVMSSARSAP